MKLFLRDYYVYDKIAQNIAEQLPNLTLLYTAPNIPGAFVKRYGKLFQLDRLKSRHVKNIRIK